MKNRLLAVILMSAYDPNVWSGRASQVGFADLAVSGLASMYPALIRGTRDDGNLPFHFEPPRKGGHLRIVESAGKPADYDPAADTFITAPHPPRKTEGGTWERGGQNRFTTRTHKSETLDYGILLSGERILHTDDGQRALKPGDVVIQTGSWHAWSNPNQGSQMAFVMMGASFED